MSLAAKLLTLLAAILFFGACRHTAPAPLLPADALVPSPRLIVGRITAIDAAQGFAFVEIASDAPSAALAAGAELIARTLELQESGQLRTSRFVRGRTLGTTIVAGQPSAGDEVVWLAP